MTLKILALLTLLSVEDPTIAKRQKRVSQVEEIHSYIEEQASRAELVSYQSDWALMASIGYFESRYHPALEGDCRLIGPPPATKRCASVGPFQITKAAPKWMHIIKKEWAGVTVDDLRNPRINAKASYDILVYHKRRCGGSPAVWLTAYTTGRCPKGDRPNFEGIRRCAVASALLKRAFGSDELICGHEGKRLRRRTRRYVDRLRKYP